MITVPAVIRIAVRPAPHVQALLDGRVEYDRSALTVVPVESILTALRRAIRDREFDITEMPLVTLAMAVDAGDDWMGVPVVMVRRFQHAALRTPENSKIEGPRDLIGCKVGVRSYSQTSGVWVRGILEQDYGVSPNRITWVTTEDAHVPGFTDPSFAQRAAENLTLQQLLDSGEIVAAIADGTTSFAHSRSVIPDPDIAAAEWRRRTGVYPVNHVIAFRRALLDCEPRLPNELQRIFQASRNLWLDSVAMKPADDLPHGRDVHENAINLGLEFAFRQGLTTKALRYEDVFFTTL